MMIRPGRKTIISIRYIIDYEIRSSWWAPWISFGPLKEIVSLYFSWKVRRKHRRYASSVDSYNAVRAHLLKA